MMSSCLKCQISLIFRHRLQDRIWLMIGILVFPDFQLLDAAGPISVFEIATRLSGASPSIRVLAANSGPVRSTSGVEMVARGFKPSGAISTLIVAGGEGVDAAARCDRTLAFVRGMAKRGVRLASVCSGAFILAEAGVLDGRRATTHWQRTRQFLASYPRVKLEPDRIFVRDGNIWSSAGISAGIDLALAMAAEDFGDDVAQKTARQLVLYHRRSGGQSQFSSLLELKAPSGRFGPLLAPRRRRRWSGCGSRWRGSACNPPARRSNASRSQPAFVIRSGCAVPSSAPSASRRNRCAAPRGRDRAWTHPSAQMHNMRLDAALTGKPTVAAAKARSAASRLKSPSVP
jgi:putative intracellular protease/amidase